MAEASEKVKAICVNYAAFTIECAMNETLKADFKQNPKPYLNKQIGMKIPEDENVKVILDDSRWRWPIVLVKTDEGEFVIEEGRLEINVKGEAYYQEIQDYLNQQKALAKAPLSSKNGTNTFYIKNPQDFEQTHKYDQSEKIDTVIQDMQVKDITILMPFQDVDTDMLGMIQYNNDSEIVLSSCS